MTGCTCNVGEKLEFDQEYCELHVLSLTVLQVIGSKENTKMIPEMIGVSLLVLKAFLFSIVL